MRDPGRALEDIAPQLAETAGQLARLAGRRDGAPTGGAELEAVRVARDLDALGDAALKSSVSRARAAGHTWQQIGDLLGVSRQAAFQRFGSAIDPRTGRPMSSSVPPGAAGRGTRILIDWIEGRHDAVAAEFGAEMAGRVTPAALAEGWARAIGTVGRYEHMGKPAVTQRGDLTVVEIPLFFEAGELKGRAVFDPAGRVTGLWAVAPDAP